jgi:hypothetical protein
MDETENQLPIAPSQEAVLAIEYVAETRHAIDEVFASFSIVMKVNFHIGDSLASHLRQRFHQLRIVFLFRKEKGVAWRIAGGVAFAPIGNCRPFCPPQCDTLLSGFPVSPKPPRFVMVGHGYPDILDGRDSPRRHPADSLP